MPSYSYTEKYISALGVPEWSPRASFDERGVLPAGRVVSRRCRDRGSCHSRTLDGCALPLLAATNAVGNVLVGLVHGGSPLWNDGYEWLHGLGAFLAFGGGNGAIVVGYGAGRPRGLGALVSARSEC